MTKFSEKKVRAAVEKHLTGKSGLDGADVWALTNRIIATLKEGAVKPEVAEPALPPRPEGSALEGKRWWVSWYSADNAFALWFPWWISGYSSNDEDILVAAVIADTEQDAVDIIMEAYDKTPDHLEFRFIDELGDKSPYSDRFPKADWHVWPE